MTLATKDTAVPRYQLTLPDVEQSVARPVIFAILDQISDITRLDKDAVKINFIGPTGAMQTPGTSIDDAQGSTDAQFSTGRYTFVDVQETYQLGAMQEMFVWGNEHMPVFLDPELGVAMAPIYATSDVVIQIRFRSPSKTEVKRWIDQQLIKTSQGRDINLHTVSYTYPLAYTFLELLNDIWTLREQTEGYGETFRQYLLKRISPRATILSTQAGELRHLAIKETESQIQGLFDFQGVPDQPQRQDQGTWEISFSYKFSYQRPVGLQLEYPLAVHNNFIPDKWQPKPADVVDPRERRNRYSKSYEALSLFELGVPQPWERPPMPYVRVPENDDFPLDRVRPDTATWMLALCFLDETRQDLISFRELGDYCIDEDILEFLVGEAPYMTKLYQSLFYITHYKNFGEQPEENLEIRSSDMMVRSKTPLSYRDNHRVRFAMNLDIHRLPWEALERLGKYPKAFVKILAAINDLLACDPDFSLLRDRAKIQPWELTYTYWVLTGGRSPTTKDYPWTDLVNFGKHTDDGPSRYLGSVDEATVKRYYRQKFLLPQTVQSAFIVAKARQDEAGSETSTQT